jgi:hypothetical protein
VVREFFKKRTAEIEIESFKNYNYFLGSACKGEISQEQSSFHLVPHFEKFAST